MKTSKKFKIGNINVQSFITNVAQIDKMTIKGGEETENTCIRTTTFVSEPIAYCTSTATMVTKSKKTTGTV